MIGELSLAMKGYNVEHVPELSRLALKTALVGAKHSLRGGANPGANIKPRKVNALLVN